MELLEHAGCGEVLVFRDKRWQKLHFPIRIIVLVHILLEYRLRLQHDELGHLQLDEILQAFALGDERYAVLWNPALENQRFHLHLARLSDPSEGSGVRRAVIEGTATFVQNVYRRRFLHDETPIAERLEGMRSVIAAAPGAFAINAQTIFDYSDGALFVRDLYRRAGGWRLVNRALAEPPRRSTQILHPRTWPTAVGASPVHLGIGPLLRPDWQPVGGGAAGEERALVILLAGTIATEASSGASGWDGGRFAVWRPRSGAEGCGSDCAAGDVGVIAFRWRHPNDAEQFALAVPAYMLVGLLAERLNDRIWKLGDGYAALGTGARGSALAFAPTEGLAGELSRRAASSASYQR